MTGSIRTLPPQRRSAAAALFAAALLLITLLPAQARAAEAKGASGPAPAALAAVAVGNDDLVDAKSLTGFSGLTEGSNVGATAESGEPSLGNVSVWYRWTAPASGTATFSTAGSNYDTLLGAYTGSNVAALTQRAFDDDSGPGLQSLLTFSAVSGTTYRIGVGGFAGSTGAVRLTWQLGTPSVRILDVTKVEGDSGTSGMRFKVRLSGPTVDPVTVQFSTQNGTAKAPGDYIAQTSMIAFEPGQTINGVGVQIKGDTQREPNERLDGRLSGAANATIARAVAVGTIRNDD
jgi:hypothetical protein